MDLLLALLRGLMRLREWRGFEPTESTSSQPVRSESLAALDGTHPRARTAGCESKFGHVCLSCEVRNYKDRHKH